MTDFVVDARNLTKTYQMGDVEVNALRGLSITISPGEVIAIMGPSGSGKSTLMNMLGCLDRPSDGEYYLDGEDVAHMNDDQLADIRNRKVGFVFQQFNLLSRASALMNVELPLRYSMNGNNRQQKAKDALISVGLGDRIHHRPSELSGGQQQRAGVARALAADPPYLLMDEPFGALDALTRETLQQELINLKKQLKKTIVFVTHDIFEALLLGDRIAILHQGTLHQIDTKQEVLARPATEFVQDLFAKPARQLAHVRDGL